MRKLIGIIGIASLITFNSCNSTSSVQDAEGSVNLSDLRYKMDDPEFNPNPTYSKVEVHSHLKDGWAVVVVFEGHLTSRQIYGIKDYIGRLTMIYHKGDINYKNSIRNELRDRYPYIIYAIQVIDESEVGYFLKQTEDKY